MHTEKFLIVEGRVVGGHRLQDLGITVPYREEVTLHYDRAAWSRDLNHALQNGLVAKKRVVSGHDSPQGPVPAHVAVAPPRVSPPSGIPAPIAARQAPARPARATAPHAALPSAAAGDGEEMAELREMNKQLLHTTERLMAQQQALLEQLASYMAQGPAQSPAPLPRQSPAGGKAGVAPDPWELDEEVDAPFVPSKIRTGQAKAHVGAEVEADTKSGGENFNKAAEALKAMRPPKGRGQ